MRLFVSRGIGPFRVGANFGPGDFRRMRARSQPALGRDFVYVIEGSGAVKIGVTSDLDGRLAHLQTGSPHRLSLAYSTRVAGDAYAVEAEAHAMLARHRIGGEWFAVPADVAVAAVSGAVFRFGSRGAPTAGAGSDLARRNTLAALLGTPLGICVAADQMVPFLVYGFGLLVAMLVTITRTGEDRGGFRVFLNWCGTLGVGFVAAIVTAALVGIMVPRAHADEDVPHTPENFISHDGATFCPSREKLAEYVKAVKAHDEAWAFGVGCSELIGDSRIATLDTIDLGAGANVHIAHIRALNLEHFGQTGYILVFERPK